MAGDVKVAVVSKALDTGAGGTTDFTKAGFGTPKACIFLLTNDSLDDADVDAQSRMSIGFSDFISHFCIAHQDEDASAKVDCDAIKSNTKVYTTLDVGGGVNDTGTASTVTDGVRITNDTSLPSGHFATVIMFGGADLKVDLVNAAINSIQDGTVTPTVTLDDNDDKLIFFIGSDITAEDSASSGINNSFGVCHATGSDGGGWTFSQRCMGWASDHNNNDGSPFATVETDHVLKMITETGGDDWALEVTALSASGNTLTLTTRDTGAGANMEVYLLVLDLDDRSAKVGDVIGPVASEWTPAVSLGFTPQYVGLGLTVLNAYDTIGTDEKAGSLGISSNTGTGEETCHTWYNEDAAATTNTNNLFRSRALDLRTDDLATIENDYSHSSFNSGDWTYSKNDGTSGDGRFFYWTIEEAAAGDTTISVPQDSFTQTDNEPDIQAPIAVPQDSFTQTDNIPDLNTGVRIDIPQDSLVQTDNAPTVPQIIGVPQDSLSQTDQVPNINTGVTVDVPSDAQTQVDNIPGINTGVNAVTPQDSLSQTDNVPTIEPTVGVPEDSLSQVDNAPDISTGVTVEVPADTLTETDNIPVIKTSIAVPQDSLAQTDNAPDLNTGVTVDVPQDSLTETDNVPTIEPTVGVSQDSFTQTDNTPLLFTGVNVVTPQDSLTETDNAPDLNTGVNVETPQDSLVQTDNIPAVNPSTTINVPVDILSITDQVPDIRTGVTVVLPANDNLTITDFVPVITAGAGVVTKQPIRGFIRNVGRLMNP